MLEVRDVVGAYGPIRALDGVSVRAERGGITAVLGANGAGKTSLLRSISGLLRPRSGSVTLDSREITGQAPEEIVRLGICHVPEGRGVIAELTVEENLRLGGCWRERSVVQPALEEAYELFPALAERRQRSADTLSGGERQMLSIARALVARPEVLLLDEPSLGLAPRVAANVMSTIARLRDELQLAVLLVEQNARAALAIADSAVVLNLGRVVASGKPEELAANSQLRHAYLGF